MFEQRDEVLVAVAVADTGSYLYKNWFLVRLLKRARRPTNALQRCQVRVQKLPASYDILHGRWVMQKEVVSRWWARLNALPVWIKSSLGALIWLRACDQVGANTRTFWRPNIENRGRIVIGSRVRLNSNWAPIELVSGPKGVIDIGDGVFINYGTIISANLLVRIGSNVMLGNYCIVGDTDIPGIGQPPGGPSLEPRPVEIGDGAWLAARVTVMPGARIGAGAVIAAGSVVAGDIPPGKIAGGIPARVLRAG